MRDLRCALFPDTLRMGRYNEGRTEGGILMCRPQKISELIPIVMNQIEKRFMEYHRELARWFEMTASERDEFEKKYQVKINPALGIPEDEIPF
jgi:hypothetical protein